MKKGCVQSTKLLYVYTNPLPQGSMSAGSITHTDSQPADLSLTPPVLALIHSPNTSQPPYARHYLTTEKTCVTNPSEER